MPAQFLAFAAIARVPRTELLIVKRDRNALVASLITIVATSISQWTFTSLSGSGLPKGLGERRFSLPSFPFSPETPDTQARLLPFLLSNRVRARIGVRVSLALKH